VPSSELLRVEGLSARWGSDPVLRSLDFTVARGEFIALLGPNGAGKTTLLRVLAGLERSTEGRVTLEGRELLSEPAHRRGLGLVAQEPSLFAHRTVRENIAYGLFVRRWDGAQVSARVAELLELLGLTRFGERYPGALSGGEQQKVALARALAPSPPLVLLDEPFASVDPEFRAELRAEFRTVLASTGIAALHVTHDREEGLFLGDRVLLLLEGAIAQAGTPAELFDHPRSARIARFLGYNLLPGPGGRPVAVLPERLHLSTGANLGGLRGRIVAAGTIGTGSALHVELPDGTRVEARRRREEGTLPVGVEVSLAWTDAIEFSV
jgi:ABC-type sulfate/molybdate transport systems ATPase subunit